jgi:hypothetical protein
MKVQNGLDDLPAEPLLEFHHPFLVAGRTKMPPFE